MAGVAILADTVIVATSFLAAAKLSHVSAGWLGLLESHGRLLLFSILVVLGSFTALGLYRTISYSSFQTQAYRAGKGFLFTIAAIFSALFLRQNLFYSRVLLLVFFLLLPMMYGLVWTLLRAWMRVLQEKGYGRWNTLAVGSEPYLRRLLERVKEYPRLGYDVVSVITSPHGDGDRLMHVECSAVEQIVREKNIGLIAFSSSHLNGSFDQLEGLCRERRIAMRVISPESDLLFSRARQHDIAGIPLFTPGRKRVDAVKRVTKRVFDVAGASLALALLSPLFMLVAIATSLESHGPVLFRQRRSLADTDPPFEFYKFRSMVDEADELKGTLFRHNETNGALFKMKNDPRLTKVGKIIRRYSIDELPQLMNVLKGEMSLVGPRPLPVKDFARLEAEDHMGGYYRNRAHAKPGMTGLWQISGRSDIGFREMVLLDLYYIEHQTILFDVEILAQTIPVVLFGRGAY